MLGGESPVLESLSCRLLHLSLPLNQLPQTSISVPRLQVLELTDFSRKTKLPANYTFPVLKMLTLSADSVEKSFAIPSLDALCLEQCWILPGRLYTIALGHQKSSMLMKGADTFTTCHHQFKALRIDYLVKFSAKGLVSMLQARREAVQIGTQVGGVEMVNIETLTLDISKIEEAKHVTKLRGLVELVDCRDAPEMITIEC